VKIYVSNIPFDSTEDQLLDHFGQFGAVADVTFIHDRSSGNFRGFGFVEMIHDRDALSAIAGLNGIAFGGRKLMVSEAHPRREEKRNRGRERRGERSLEFPR
jgi:cold-inducible RNA-binding protein